MLDHAYRLQRVLWKLFRPRTRGVKVLLFNDSGEVLLIRNGYGRSDQFVLPGGGVRPWEAPDQAARREIREELGLEVGKVVTVSTHTSAREGKRDTIHLFQAQVDGMPNPDNWEVIEARFFALDAIPNETSPATARRVAEWIGERSADGEW